MKFRKKPVVIEAVQWLLDTEHPEVYYLSSGIKGVCKRCEFIMDLHGYCNTLEGRHIVCPGDWIIEGIKGEFYPCKPDIFELTYDRVIDIELDGEHAIVQR